VGGGEEQIAQGDIAGMICSLQADRPPRPPPFGRLSRTEEGFLATVNPKVSNCSETGRVLVQFPLLKLCQPVPVDSPDIRCRLRVQPKKQSQPQWNVNSQSTI
jgi:hypothetical protein